jgi:hypothetical protein
MSELSPELHRLGTALHEAAADDLEARAPARRSVRRRRRLVLAVAAAIVLPSAAFAADQLLLTTDDVANSMPAGAQIFVGRHATCSVVTENVEYHCVLDRAPMVEGTDSAGNPIYKGVVEPTVDANHKVNGGCRGLTTDGLQWQCYIGQKAVDEQIVGPGFLGETVSGPGVG